jgi:RNA polymerase sigma-70 factor (ECF subfamily)
LENWLRRVLFLSFIRWYKKNKSTVSVELDESLLTNEFTNSGAINIDAGTVIRILSNLTEEKQEIVKLRFWGELKFSEIAERLNKNEAAVKKMFYRTLNEIKGKLE